MDANRFESIRRGGGEGVLAFTCWHVKRLWEQIQILTWLYYGVRVSSLRSLGNWTLRSPFQLITRHATSCYQWQIYAGHSRATQHICKYAWIVTSLCGNLDLAMTWHLRDQTPLPFSVSANLRADLAKIFTNTHTLVIRFSRSRN